VEPPTPAGEQLEACLTDGLGDDKVLNKLTGISSQRLKTLSPRNIPSANRQSRLMNTGTYSAAGLTFPSDRSRGKSRLIGAAATMGVAFGAAIAAAQPAAAPPAGSGLPVPRFVSLKSDRVNLRNGPGTDYPTGWVYRRAGLPVEVVKEFESWRQVRDAEGATGWVLQSLLSGRRTGLVLPWERKAGVEPPVVAIHANDTASSAVVAKVEAGVIADLHSCDSRWCRVTVEQFGGYIEQKKLWGVYEGETIK
jgi:SH3-like domain-containing protein